LKKASRISNETLISRLRLTYSCLTKAQGQHSPLRQRQFHLQAADQDAGPGVGEVFGLNKRGNLNRGNLNLWGNGVTIGLGVAVGDASVVGFFREGFGVGEVAGASAGEGPLAVSACELASVFSRVTRFAGDADCVGVPVSNCDSTRATQMVRPITKTTGTSLALIQQILKAKYLGQHISTEPI